MGAGSGGGASAQPSHLPPRSTAPPALKMAARSAGEMTGTRAVWANPSPPTKESNAKTAIVRTMAFSPAPRSEEHTSELQSLMRISYAVFCLKKKKQSDIINLPRHVHQNNKPQHYSQKQI